MLCRISLLKREKETGTVPVYLNVYDLTPFNGYAYWLGLGIYHSGVQDMFCSILGVEYGFGAHDHSSTGIFEVEPRQCPGFTFRKSILIGRTNSSAREVRTFMEKLAREYSGNSYHLITKNCNHFCNDVCLQLTGKPIPRWVNRLARLGFLCKCVLPAELNDTKIRQVVKGEDRVHDIEKRRLRSHSSRQISSSAPLSHQSMLYCPSSSENRSGRQKRRAVPATLTHSTSTSAY